MIGNIKKIPAIDNPKNHIVIPAQNIIASPVDTKINVVPRSGCFNINIVGKSSHGARPQEGKTPLNALSNMITALSTIVTDHVDPEEIAVSILAELIKDRNAIDLEEQVIVDVKNKQKEIDPICKMLVDPENAAEIVNDNGEWNDRNVNDTQDSYVEYEGLVSSLGDLIYLGEYNGHTYFRNTQDLDWSDAKQAAENLGGYLASIHTSEESSAIISFGFFRGWIGLYQDIDDSNYSEP